MASASAPAFAQTGTEASIFSPANIAGGLLRAGVSYARMVADIRYGALEVDAERGAVMLRDLQIRGIGDQAACQVTLGRAQFSGITFWGAEDMRGRLDAADLKIANNCFGPQAAMIGMVTGSDSIPVARLALDWRQVSSSGAGQLDLEIVSPEIARIEGSVDFDYVSIYLPDALKKLAQQSGPTDLEDPGADDPAMGEDRSDSFATNPERPEVGLRGTLRAAHLSIEDLGVWGRLGPILPPDATNPQAIDAGIVTAEPGSPLSEVQEGLAAAVKGFVAQPGIVTAEIRPEAPVDFDSRGWTEAGDPVAFFAPVFTNAAPRPPLRLIADPSAAGDARSLGLALARGEGVPMNHRRAIGLLSPLKGDAEVSLALATMIAEADPAAAYPHAMAAANLGAPGAPAVLDRIEAKLPTAVLLAAQMPAATPLKDEMFASVQALRDAALAREQGDGVPRSYALAWRLAASAAAAGDGAAQALMARLNARFGAEPVWITAREAAADAAMGDWTTRKLGTVLAGAAQ
ncbi:hypothetical protein [Paracoccus sp. S1E-3]|uniref:hypothetical protein n=1 Tax=Paracoccus sp. S1E-3 TaxID=2756130 RepID=UPI002105D53A|nr:hypothetical protein [Paracoccus sp. S1E-3]